MKETTALQVYVEGPDFPIVQKLKNDAIYEEFRVIVKVTGKARAH